MKQITDKAFRGQPGLYEGEPAFLRLMAEQAPDGPALEVGVRHGYSLLLWAQVRQDRGQIIGIDKVSDRRMRQNVARSGLPITLVIGDSATVPLGPSEFAFMFIDGNHRPEGIRADIARFMPMVMPGGVVVFHDYGRRREGPGPVIGVTDAVDEWQDVADWEVLGREQTMLAFRRPQ